ncbi:MAG: hypothetical protein IJR80_03155 [Treponema sp.]|nr:hypothetical protein [Treponema sp.]
MSENKNEFKGDVELVTKGGEFDIVIEEGLVKDCQNFDTAVLLSLFGGNCGDINGKEKETWWGNLIPETKEEERIQSEFGCMSKALPITSGNLQKACEAAKRDVSWIKDEAGADKIEAQLSATNAQRVQLEIDIQKDAATIAGGIYETQWQEAVR